VSADRTVVDDPAGQRFELRVGGAVAGFAAYRGTGSTLTLTHTEVDPAYEGQGLGSVLVRGTLDQLRERGVQVRPACPFVRSFLGRHPDYLDLVPPAERERFGLPAA
jgi:predicted GNAT family acetyltransferase